VRHNGILVRWFSSKETYYQVTPSHAKPHQHGQSGSHRITSNGLFLRDDGLVVVPVGME
jgi:hypothetical protein